MLKSAMDESVRSQSLAANSLDFDNYMKSAVKKPIKPKKLNDRINVSQLFASDCNVGVDEISRCFKVRSSLCPGLIARHEQQVSHCAIN
jgi:hypothetical protein